MDRKINVRVYFADTDTIGVVYHGNYLNFAERARTEVSRMCGLDIVDLAKKGKYFVVKKASLHYIAPAKLDDALEVTVSVTRFGKTSLEIMHKITNQQTGIDICEVLCLLVFVSNKNGKISPVIIPEDIKAVFKRI